MTGPNITLSKRGHGIEDTGKMLAQLRRADVLVGITQESSSRPGSKINNAEILYIFSHGSPKRNQPPRMWIEPAIAAPGNKEPIAEKLKDAAAELLNKDPHKCNQFLRQAGQLGQAICQRWPYDSRNSWAPNARSTVLAKLRRLHGKAHKDAMAKIEGMDSIGTVEGLNTVGVDTGALLKAFRFVVRGVR